MARNDNPLDSFFQQIFAGVPMGDVRSDDAGIPHVDFSQTANVSDIKDRFAAMSRRSLVGIAAVALIVLGCAYWWFHPALNIHNPDIWALLFPLAIALFVLFRSARATYEKGGGSHEPSPSKAKLFKGLALIPLVVLAAGIVGWLLSASFFPGNAKKFASILPTEEYEFAEDIAQVNYDEIPVIDRDSAVLLGNRTMGSISDLVSQFEISPIYSQINYNDRPVRVSPLVYADLFKWLQNRGTGIPAYAIVDMTTQDAQVVRLDEGKGIKYSESEPLARNIDRYVQLKYPTYMFGEKSFEIDDEGNPWWICPVRTFTLGLFGGETVSRAVLVNAVTGETQDLAVDEVPGWVDRVYPSDLLIRQYNWRGAYSNGWFNSWLGQNGVVQTTPGINGAAGYNYIAKDDDVWLYTGVTSATGDNSIIGFVLINQRTAESHFYSVAGATEESAMSSAEGQVQNLRYAATFPLLINVSDRPTYFMALKDGAGLVKKYAMVDIERYQNVAVGDTVAETQKTYESLIAADGGSADSGAPAKTFEASGTIATVAQAVIEGNSHFYVTLEGDDHIYDFPLPALVQVVGYGVGDHISFSYVEGSPTSPVSEIADAKLAASTSASGGSEGAGAPASGAASGSVSASENEPAGGAASASA